MPSTKNVLLINPWIYDFTAYDFWIRPLGLLYIAGILRRCARVRLDFIDCLDRTQAGLKPSRTKPDGRSSLPKEEIPKPAVLKGIPRRYSRYGIPISVFREALNVVPIPDLVLITGMMTYWYPGVQAVIEEVKKKFGGAPVALGGIYPSLMPEHAKQHSGADIIIRGAGENKILPLIRDVLGDGTSVPGEFPRLDDLPLPAYDLVRDTTWQPVLTSRGCPFLCSFCASRLLFEGFEQRNPASVVAEIERAAISFGTRHFVFYDDALFMNKSKHLAPILNGVIDSGLDVSFHTPNGVHVREIDEEFARLLKRAGVKSLYLSQESVDTTFLTERSPKVMPSDLESALDCLEKAGFRRQEISVYLIAGLPGQDTESIRSAICRVRELRAIPRLALFSPIPGTLEWQELVRCGRLAEDSDPLLHNKTVFPFYSGQITPEEWAALRKLADGPRV